MALARRARRRSLDIWPGFVDALSTLLMVIIFVLLVFILAQYFLGAALSGSELANNRLARQLAELAGQLSLEKESNAGLHTDLSRLNTELQSSTAERDRLAASKAELEGKTAALDSQLSSTAAERALLSQQLDAIQQELARVAAALDISEKQVADQKVQLSDLGTKLNMALASKVEELKKYRSEFFGKLRQVLGSRPGIRVEGDRFIFQSELLFATGSAELGKDGARQVHDLAVTLAELRRDIPADVSWVLRVDGHTDKRPVMGGKYKSNWELSTARALTVVRTLIADGIPPDRLAAAGFGEYQPVDTGANESALAKNRRIELRLDQR
jgi:chemotaxis protein MotB